MDQEDIDRIENDHRPVIGWQNGVVFWQCFCGSRWPCRVVLLADEARLARAYRRQQ